MHRILHITSTLALSGTASQIAILAAGLPKDRFELHLAVVCRRPVAHDVSTSDVRPTIIRTQSQVDPFAFWKLRRLISKLQPDIVHTWEFDANTVGRIAAVSAGVNHLIASERRIDNFKTDLESSIDRRLARRTDRIVVNSCAVQQFNISRGLPESKIAVIPSACHVTNAPSSESRERFLAAVGLPSEAKLIAYVGSIQPRKRLKEIVWATDQLKAVGVPAHLLVIGDGPYRLALERYRWLNRVDDRVHFLGRRDDVRRFLAHTDVLWQPSAIEGQSSAILEAMAAGVAVVAADSGGNRELILNGETGYLVSTAERAGFARWTLPILEDPSLARRFGVAAKERVANFHNAGEMVARYAQLYDNVLKAY